MTTTVRHTGRRVLTKTPVSDGRGYVVTRQRAVHHELKICSYNQVQVQGGYSILSLSLILIRRC